MLVAVYEKAGGKRTKRAVSRVSLPESGRSASHDLPFEASKQAMMHHVTFAHGNEDKRLCIYTEASDSHWSGILTQVPLAHLRKEHKNKAHDPLAFHSGRFSSVQFG